MHKKNNFHQIFSYFLALSAILALFAVIITLIKFKFFLSFILSLYLINILTNIWIFLQWRHLEAKISWMLVLSLMPILGHVFYFLFGQKYKNAQKRNYYFKTYNEYFLGEKRTSNDLIKTRRNIINATENLSQRKFKDVDFEIISNGFDYFKKVFEKLQSAQKFIHIEMYIIKRGEIWTQMRQILLTKAQLGLEVRIIVDGFGILDISKRDLEELKKFGVQIIQYGKINFPFINSNLFYRIHKKIIIVDGIHLFSGGNNISDEYASFSNKYGIWLDANFYATGQLVRDYSLSFIYSWNLHLQEKLDIEKFAPLVISNVPTNSIGLMIEDGPHSEEQTLEQFLVMMIFKSKKKIQLTTPYFVPTEKIISALRTALISGIEIEIYVPGHYDKSYTFVSTLYFLRKLKPFGLKIYFLNESFLHSKIAIFDDDFAYIGTMNLDIRSLYSQFEIITLAKGKAVLDLSILLKKYKTYSLEWNEYPDAHKRKNIILSFMIQLFKPML